MEEGRSRCKSLNLLGGKATINRTEHWGKLCLYDGITLFITDPDFEKHLVNNSGRYRLIGSFDYESGIRIGGFTGKFRNFDIYTAANSTGRGVVIGGSLHKWKNKSHNYDHFLWQDFSQVYQEILKEFRFDPKQTLIWVLEGGLNNTLFSHWKFKGNSFPENTIFLNGDPKVYRRNKYTKGGVGIDIEKGSCTTKMYDKGRQNNLDYELLRTECSYKRKRLKKFNINSFEDLLDYQKHQKLGCHLIKTFDTLLLKQPDVLQNAALAAEDKMFLLEYSNSFAWVALRKESDYQYQIQRKKYLRLIDKYSEINYRKELLKQMRYQLQ